MSSYQTHLIAGILISFLFYYLIQDLISLSLEVVFISVVLIFLGSVFPDIDHKNSKIHKMSKHFIVLILMLLFGFLALPNFSASILSSSLVGIGSYTLISSLKMTHRGRVHSFKFCVLTSIFVGLCIFYLFQSFIPGLFFFISYLSHLVLDYFS